MVRAPVPLSLDRSLRSTDTLLLGCRVSLGHGPPARAPSTPHLAARVGDPARSVLRRWGGSAEVTWRPEQQGRTGALTARISAHALGFSLDAPSLKAVLGMRTGIAHYLAHRKYRSSRPQVPHPAISLEGSWRAHAVPLWIPCYCQRQAIRGDVCLMLSY